MYTVRIEFADIVVKQATEAWSEEAGFDAQERLEVLFGEQFSSGTFVIESVEPDDQCLSITVSAPGWPKPRDFLLLPDGSLAWLNLKSPPRVRRVRR